MFPMVALRFKTATTQFIHCVNTGQKRILFLEVMLQVAQGSSHFVCFFVPPSTEVEPIALRFFVKMPCTEP